MSLKTFGPLLLVVPLIGCNGEIHSRVLTPSQLQTELSQPEGIRGVFTYYEKTAIETDDLTTLADATGKPVAGPCIPTRMNKVVTYTDQDHPIEVWYEPGLLEANQFGVQMSNSVLTAVNSQSTPDQGKTLSNVASSADTLAKLAAGGGAPPPAGGRVPAAKAEPACNAGPTLVSFSALHLP